MNHFKIFRELAQKVGEIYFSKHTSQECLEQVEQLARETFSPAFELLEEALVLGKLVEQHIRPFSLDKPTRDLIKRITALLNADNLKEGGEVKMAVYNPMELPVDNIGQTAASSTLAATSTDNLGSRPPKDPALPTGKKYDSVQELIKGEELNINLDSQNPLGTARPTEDQNAVACSNPAKSNPLYAPMKIAHTLGRVMRRRKH